MSASVESPPARICVWCGSSLNAGASRCSQCKAWLGSRRCDVCSEPVPLKASQCNACKSLQDWTYKSCGVCTARIPKDAERCNACSSMQNWWRRDLPFLHTFLLVLAIFVQAVTNAVPRIIDFLNRDSNTSFMVIDATPRELTLIVDNTGRKRSLLRDFKLDFGDLPLEPVKLEVKAEDRSAEKLSVAPEGRTTVRLITTGITPAGATKDEIRKLLKPERSVTLTMTVNESDKPGKRVSQELSASFVREFVLIGITKQ